MNLPPGFPGGGRDTKYLKHTSLTYIMYIVAWKWPFPWPAHPALSCRNHYYASIHHNSSIPKHKTRFRKRKNIPGNFLESSGCSWNYSKMVLVDSSTNSTLFWGQDCQNRTHRTNFMTKVDRKQISVYLEIWFPLNWVIFYHFWCSFFLNIMSWDEEFNEHSGNSWNTTLWAQISKNRNSAPGNICQEIYLETFSCNIWIQW